MYVFIIFAMTAAQDELINRELVGTCLCRELRFPPYYVLPERPNKLWFDTHAFTRRQEPLNNSNCAA